MHAIERASPEFSPSNAVRPQLVGFCGIRKTQNRFRPDFRPGHHYVSLITPFPRPSSWWGGASSHRYLRASSFGPSSFVPPCFLTFDYFPPPLNMPYKFCRYPYSATKTKCLRVQKFVQKYILLRCNWTSQCTSYLCMY